MLILHLTCRTSLKLPWQPLISVDGKTVYDLDEQLKVSRKDFISTIQKLEQPSLIFPISKQIVKHVESWNISALEAVGQIFTPGLRSSGE